MIEAKVISVGDGVATIEKRDGSRFSAPFSRFYEADRDFLKEWRKTAEGPGFEQLNEALGVRVFVDDNLWDDPDEAVAERLGWAMESRTDSQSSFRHYPRSEAVFLGARPYSMALYGKRGNADSFSLVFANKGDALGPYGSMISSELKEAIEDDADTIESALEGLLGEAVRQSYGEGSAYRRVSRWDWRGHAFLLSEKEEEYVSLMIERSAAADSAGRPDRTRDAEIREMTAANVLRDPNGDVRVTNIPMVDQGPKGYCVPATFERCMRYLGIPADMYLLAMSGQTEAGGGTYLEPFILGVRRDVTRNGRSMKDLNIDMETRDLARFIDQGLPVLWVLNSTPAFNAVANEHTRRRAEVTDWEKWNDELDRLEELGRNVENDPHYGHVAIVVGYNKETDEVAISDSWGPEFETRWVLAKTAERVSEGFLLIGI